jgi:lambda repressor-like predicted transcriptional regulator
MIEEYERGALIKHLGERFGVHRVTVTALLRRNGVHLRQLGLANDEVFAAAILYRQGWSLASLGERFGVDPATMLRALRATGVAVRPPWRR